MTKHWVSSGAAWLLVLAPLQATATDWVSNPPQATVPDTSSVNRTVILRLQDPTPPGAPPPVPSYISVNCVRQAGSGAITPAQTSLLITAQHTAEVSVSWTGAYVAGSSPATSGYCRITVPFSIGSQQFDVPFIGASLSQYEVAFNGARVPLSGLTPPGRPTEYDVDVGLYRFDGVSTPLPLRIHTMASSGFPASCVMNPAGTPATATWQALTSPHVNTGLYRARMQLLNTDVPNVALIGSCTVTPPWPARTARLNLVAPELCNPPVLPPLAACDGVGIDPKLRVIVRRLGEAQGLVLVNGGNPSSCAGVCDHTATGPVTILASPASNTKVAQYAGDCLPTGAGYAGAPENDAVLKPWCFAPAPITVDRFKTCEITLAPIEPGEDLSCN